MGTWIKQTLPKVPQRPLTSLMSNPDTALLWSQHICPVQSAIARIKRLVLLRPWAMPYMTCTWIMIWAVLSGRGDAYGSAPCSGTWLDSHFREEDPREGRRLSQAAAACYFPANQGRGWSASPYPGGPRSHGFSASRSHPWSQLNLDLWYLQYSTLSSVCDNSFQILVTPSRTSLQNSKHIAS